MIMHKNKKIIIKIVSFMLLIVSILTMSTNIVNAKTRDYSKCNDDNLSKNYNVSYKYKLVNKTAQVSLSTVKGTLKISKIEEGYVDELEDQFVADDKITHITNVNSYIGKIVYNNTDKNKSKNPTIIINQATQSELDSHIKITFTLAEGDDYCDSEAEYNEKTKNKQKTATGNIEIYVPVPKEGVLSTQLDIENTNINTIYCQFLRGEITDKDRVQKEVINSIIDNETAGWLNTDYKDAYKKIIPNCYDGETIVTNYTEDNLQKIIRNAIRSVYYSKITTTSTPSAKFSTGPSFEYMKDEAQKDKTHTWEFNEMPEKIEVPELKCEYKGHDDINYFKSRNENGNYNYANKKYYYAKAITVVKADYDFDYDGITDKANPDVCKKTCEEAVEVSYGPPQAVAAGFCFEYQMKVISKVRCQVEMYDAAPSLQPVCTPEPKCTHKNKQVLTQAGPTEEFDRCVYECDGGKYSQKCSNQCYKKVYGKSSINNTNSLTQGLIRPLSVYAPNACTDGHYARSGSEIIWVNDDGKNCYARWYAEKDDKPYETKTGTFHPGTGDKAGFKIKTYSVAVKGWAAKGEDCEGECHNTGCEGPQYLNASSAQRDYQNNMANYEEKVRECKAGAICSTKTSEYTISVDGYSELNDISKASLESKKTGQVNDTGILLSSDGCYNDNANDYYEAEWSFPGTWVNNKTGEISFKPITSGGWHSVPNKFCLPLDAKATNSEWWNWYMKKATGNTAAATGGTGSYKTETYNETCTTMSRTTSDVTKINVSDWNIHGTAKNFGFFSWNFDIKCFYATQNKETDKKCVPKLNNYTTRSVDNQDLFPSTDETAKTTTSVSSTGRTPGFNWTSAATIEKQNGYQVDPTVLITKIQKLKSGVYNDSTVGGEIYLDYDIELSPEQIVAIKKAIKENRISYESWDGESDYNKNNNISAYTSNFLNTYTKVNKRVKPGCNNNKNDSECLVLLSN